jgi:hypothetical protein
VVDLAHSIAQLISEVIFLPRLTLLFYGRALKKIYVPLGKTWANGLIACFRRGVENRSSDRAGAVIASYQISLVNLTFNLTCFDCKIV